MLNLLVAGTLQYLARCDACANVRIPAIALTEHMPHPAQIAVKTYDLAARPIADVAVQEK